MKSLNVVCLILVLSSLLVNAQDYKEGIIITMDGDSLHGFINDTRDFVIARNCQFKSNDGTITKYSPGEIAGFIFKDGKHYVSKLLRAD